MTVEFVSSLQYGDICRSRYGSPARYLVDGRCAYVSAMTNDICIGEAWIPNGNEEQFPLPSDEDLDQALIYFDLRKHV